MREMAHHYLLYGHGGSYNHGSEASVRCDIALLRQNFQDCKITLVSHFPEQDRQFGLDVDEIVGRDPAGRTNEEIYTAGIERITPDTVCLSVGGDMYCYPNWQRYAAIHYAALKRGARSILWSCSLEPSMLDNEMLQVLRTHHLITAREGATFRALKKYGLSNVVQVSDIAFSLTPQPTDIGLRGAYVVLNLSPLTIRRAPGILPAFQTLVTWILKNTELDIALVPHVLAATDNDKNALEALYLNDNRIWMLPPELCAAERKYVISRARFCVATRTHACIAAYASGVPTIAVGYSTKARGIAEDLKQEEFLLDAGSLNTSVLLEAFQRLVTQEDKVRRDLALLIPGYCQRTAPQEVIQILQ